MNRLILLLKSWRPKVCCKYCGEPVGYWHSGFAGLIQDDFALLYHRETECEKYHAIRN